MLQVLEDALVSAGLIPVLLQVMQAPSEDGTTGRMTGSSVCWRGALWQSSCPSTWIEVSGDTGKRLRKLETGCHGSLGLATLCGNSTSIQASGIIGHQQVNLLDACGRLGFTRHKGFPQFSMLSDQLPIQGAALMQLPKLFCPKQLRALFVVCQGH